MLPAAITAAIIMTIILDIPDFEVKTRILLPSFSIQVSFESFKYKRLFCTPFLVSSN
jgi:hypothetical protein